MASSENNNNNNNLIIIQKDIMDDIYEEEEEEEDMDDEEINENDDVFEEEDEEEEDLNSVSSSADPTTVTVAVPPITTTTTDPIPIPLPSGDRKPQPLDMESRKLFQRLWTDEDEIELLRGFLHYSTQRVGSGSSSQHHHHHHQDTAVFYDQIRSKLQLDFNKNQLVEKLRRLKKKYRNVVARTAAGKDSSFKSPHDQQTYDISRRIWGITTPSVDDEEPNNNLIHHHHTNANANANSNSNTNANVIDLNLNTTSMDSKKVQRSRKRSRVKPPTLTTPPPSVPVPVNVIPPPAPTPAAAVTVNVVEDTVRSCLTPLFKELLMNNAIIHGGPTIETSSRGFGLGMLSPIPIHFGNNFFLGGPSVDDKWRKQQILELEVYSKRLDLVQDQIKATLEELRSVGN